MSDLIASDLGTAVGVEFQAFDDLTWDLDSTVDYFTSLKDLLFVAELIQSPSLSPLSHSGFGYKVHRLSLNSPFEVTIELVREAASSTPADIAAYGGAVLSVVGGTLRLVNLYADTRVKWATSNTEVSEQKRLQEQKRQQKQKQDRWTEVVSEYFEISANPVQGEGEPRAPKSVRELNKRIKSAARCLPKIKRARPFE